MEEIADKTLPPGTGYRMDGDVVPGEGVGGQIYWRSAWPAAGLSRARRQYESWYAPISVILAVPLSLLGRWRC
jgi:HAE1 family hydrophobic/amphiphilic exporter-1